MFLSLAFTLVSLKLVEGQVLGLNAVVDLSHWNVKVDFAKAKADGIEGVFHKATQGLGYVDPNYASRKSQAVSLGLLWGAYHFANGRSGVEQANHFLRVVGNDPNTLLALDLEENPSGSSVSLTIAEDFVHTIYKATGRYPLIYGARFFLNNLISGKKTVLLNCPLWLASWTTQPVVPDNTWENWALWQYTDGKNGPEPHSVDGIGPCDRDSVNPEIFNSVSDMWVNASKAATNDNNNIPVK